MSNPTSSRDIIVSKIMAEMDSAGLPQYKDSAEKMADFFLLLKEGSEKTNLIGKLDEDKIIKYLFADSLLFLKYFDPREGACIADIGCGAGFPGIVVKLARPDLSIVFLDADGKKAAFLRESCLALGVEGIEVIHGRAEEFGKNPEYREKSDYVFSKAVGSLIMLVELCSPLLRQGGTMTAWKGSKWKEELEKLGSDYRMLGLMEPQVINTGSESETTFVCFKKASTCPQRFPRSYQVIKKENLSDAKNKKNGRKPKGRD
ncbi:MAG: 16S rRNA (guanine(527)-N(7))-methyltransferase RsmG [Firmicutes bacterium]|nr:16S rRNA (guanine(527)-N(7))-methyltransferase RsmG [Bacillota bacterium]